MGRNLLINIKSLNIPVVFTNFDYHSRQPQILKTGTGNRVVFISLSKETGQHEIVGIFMVQRTYIDNLSWRAQKWGQNTVEGERGQSFLIQPFPFAKVMPQLSLKFEPVMGRSEAQIIGGATQNIRYLTNEDVAVILKQAVPLPANPYHDMARSVVAEKLHLDAQQPLSKHAELLERNLEDMTVEQIEKLEPGLKYLGRQIATPAGIIDILCQDSADNLVIIELKRGRISDLVIGQLSRYMGWAIEQKTHDPAKVRGMIVAGDFDDKVVFAAKSNPHISLRTYSLSFNHAPPLST